MAIINFFSVAVCAEIIALLAALFTIQNKQSLYWRLFILYLLITITIEAFGFYYATSLHRSNYPFYHSLMIMQVLFFTFLFIKFQLSKKIRIGLLIGLAIFILFFTGEGVYYSLSKSESLFIANYNKYSRMLLSVFVTLFSCIFYFSIIKNDAIKGPLKYPPFWIVTGLFFYYFGSLPMFAFSKIVSQIKLGGNISFYGIVMGSLSCILYGSWIIGFICKKKQVR